MVTRGRCQSSNYVIGKSFKLFGLVYSQSCQTFSYVKSKLPDLFGMIVYSQFCVCIFYVIKMKLLFEKVTQMCLAYLFAGCNVHLEGSKDGLNILYLNLLLIWKCRLMAQIWHLAFLYLSDRFAKPF